MPFSSGLSGRLWGSGLRSYFVEGDPSNATTRFMVRVMDLLNEIEDPQLIPRLITDDFQYDDRRRGGFSFPSHGARGRFEFVRAVWDVAQGLPRFSINEFVATRGQRLALALWQIDYPQGQVVDYLDCWQLDPTLSLHQFQVSFDSDDLDDAMAELDRLDRQLESS